MSRYILIFAVLLVICLGLTAALLAQYGLSLLAPEMQPILLVCIIVAAYVSWRITTILRRREGRDDGAGRTRAASFSPGLFGGKSKALQDREARIAARRRQLIAEGKLAPEEGDTPAPAPAPEEEAEQPVRVASSASVKEKMAARAERVRRAREEGKI